MTRKRWLVICKVVFIAICIVLVGFKQNVRASMMQVGEVPIGAVVFDHNSNWWHLTDNDYSGKGENKPVEWIVVAKNHYQSLAGGNSVTLISKEVIAKYAYGTQSTNWQENNTIRTWLNDKFYDHFSREFQDQIIDTVVPHFNWDNKMNYTSTDKVFLASTKELGFTTSINGEAWEYYENDKPELRSAQLAGKLQSYWTRSPETTGSEAIAYVTEFGSKGVVPALFLYRNDGVRPVINVASGTYLAVSSLPTSLTPSMPEIPQPELNPIVQPEQKLTQQVSTNTTLNGQIVEGRFLVPMRAIFEALGTSIDWDAATKTVTGVRDNTTVKLTIDNPIATVNGKDIALDVPPKIIAGRTFVPVRFVSEALGANVEWDPIKKMATISMDETVVRVFDAAVKDFSIDTQVPVYLSVNETKRISAIIVGDNLSFDEMYPRWGTSDVSIMQVSGDVISGYSNTFAGVTERFIVTASQAVTIKGLTPGEATLKVSIGPYSDNRAQLITVKVIVR